MKFKLLFIAFIVMLHSHCVTNKPDDIDSPMRNKKMLKTKRCRYVFVVKEMDTSTCSNNIATEPALESEITSESFASDVYMKNPRHGGGTKYIQDLTNRLQNMEQQLDGEIQKNTNLNMTIAKQEMTLQNMYKFINNIKTDQHKQKEKYRDLEKKFISMELNVAEVTNVLSKKGTLSEVALGDIKKDIPVQSASKTHNCATTEPDATFRDCQEVFEKGHTTSGIYYITPLYSSCSIPVWCDMDTPPGGWLIIQRRNSGKVDFNLFWNEYREGFGSIASEYWLGLDNIFLLTNQGFYELRVDLWDFEDNKVYALYKTFKIDGERDKYRLQINGFEGSARDSLFNHNNMMFSTADDDNDNAPDHHCAREWHSGWWYNACWFALLNGQYTNKSDIYERSISWNGWKQKQLAKTEMKIRPSRIYKSSKNDD